MLTDLYLPQPFLRAFPEPESVFVEPVARYARHLHPLVSIDLSAVDPGLSGWIHLLSPIEPYDGCLGDSGQEHWGPYLQPNWLGLRLTAGHRYELLGDFRFFGVENIAGKESHRGARNALEEFRAAKELQALEEFYAKEHASFAAHKAAFGETGQVCRIPSWSNDVRKPVPALSQLGGEAPVGNMIWANVAGTAFSYADDDAAPRTADGRLFKFIAAVPGWRYRDAGADDILLFYDPVERIALHTFVWG